MDMGSGLEDYKLTKKIFAPKKSSNFYKQPRSRTHFLVNLTIPDKFDVERSLAIKWKF